MKIRLVSIALLALVVACLSALLLSHRSRPIVDAGSAALPAASADEALPPRPVPIAVPEPALAPPSAPSAEPRQESTKPEAPPCPGRAREFAVVDGRRERLEDVVRRERRQAAARRSGAKPIAAPETATDPVNLVPADRRRVEGR